jgi:hypothetical protein
MVCYLKSATETVGTVSVALFRISNKSEKKTYLVYSGQCQVR